MRLLILSAFALFAGGATAHAAEVVTVLGLPLGGKMAGPHKKCSEKELTEIEPKSLCWVGAPMVLSKGTKTGGVALPDRDRLPKWAANALFDITVSANGTLKGFEAKTHSGRDYEDIIQSVSSRFGQPTKTRDGAIRSAEWVRKDMYLNLLCPSDYCLAKFMSAADYNEWQRELADRARKDAARPIAP